MGRLFWKIFLAFWLALVVAAVGAGAAVWLQRQERERNAPELAMGPPSRMFEEMAASMLHHGGPPALREWMQDVHRRRPMPLFAVDEAGRDVLGRPVPPAALAKAREVAQHGGGFGARVVSSPSGERYLLFVPLSLIPRPGGHTPLELWQLALIGLLTSLAFSAFLAWYMSRPIRSLRWAFNAAAAGKLETRVRPLMGKRRDEIADLGTDFDRMAQQLQSLIFAQRRLLHDVSHELRSPLARLQVAVGLVRQDPAKLEGSLERIEREIARLDTMVGEILTLARLEGGTAAPAKEPIDFADLVAGIAEDARFEAEANRRRLSLLISGDAHVAGNAALLHRAVENVVRNALKFTREGTAVEVALTTQDHRALLAVTDSGPGIPPDELDKVFVPFYRGTGADATGFGLGLAIAQRAVEAHGGTIRAENVAGGGLRVEITLPLNDRS